MTLLIPYISLHSVLISFIGESLVSLVAIESVGFPLRPAAKPPRYHNASANLRAHNQPTNGSPVHCQCILLLTTDPTLRMTPCNLPFL